MFNVLKNKIKILITPILYNSVNFIVDNLFHNNAVHSSQALSSRITSSFFGNLSYFMDNSSLLNIPRQSVYNWLKHWYTPDIIPASVDTPDTLYVMADEKYIGAQDVSKDIMVKSFVTFEYIKNISKNRRLLVNRTVFSHYGDKPWEAFMDFIAKKYDFDKINTICLLGDGASWIKSGTGKLRLFKMILLNFIFVNFTLNKLFIILLLIMMRDFIYYIFLRLNQNLILFILLILLFILILNVKTLLLKNLIYYQ